MKVVPFIALTSLQAAAALAGPGSHHKAASASDICWSSPLLAGAWQCSLHLGTTTNTITESPSPPPNEPDTTGGWTGPFACASDHCVYTHQTFANGRGIAVISDGAAINALANTPIFMHLATNTGISQDLGDLNVQTPAITVKEIPGKGRGLVATRPLHRGEPIMAYTPALVFQRNFIDVLPRAEQGRLLQDAVRRLPDPTRWIFWKQMGQQQPAADDADVLDIVTTNSFNLAVPGAGAFVGNFPEVAMYNHDCRPNVAFHLDHGGVVHRTHVARPVAAAGEELSISYVDSLRARDVRRARTQRNWGFACTCAQCMLPAALRNASDHRLWRIYEVENALDLREGDALPVRRGKKGGGVQEVLDGVALLLSLYRQERLLESHGTAAYRVAAVNFAACGRKERAVEFALLALEAGVLEEGVGSKVVRDMVALMEDPEGHWSWGRRL